MRCHTPPNYTIRQLQQPSLENLIKMLFFLGRRKQLYKPVMVLGWIEVFLQQNDVKQELAIFGVIMYTRGFYYFTIL